MSDQREIEVYAHWDGIREPRLMGLLFANPSRGQEIFSFEYDGEWLDSAQRVQLDPTLGFYAGPQYPSAGKVNFGVFFDSCPDRWGRVLMRRREAQMARDEGRNERRLLESDYLLGVHDGHRMGALRFRTGGPFLDDNDELAAPPWTSLRDLEHACLQLEQDDADSNPNYGRWLRMLIAPGGSLGGARPKASVLDQQGRLWIAKFPSRRDDDDVGAWESVVHELGKRAGVVVPAAQLRLFGSTHHTFLSRRFDRTEAGQRLHFASAMTLLECNDGDDAEDGVSYLDLVDLLVRLGANTASDLEQLWRRIVFFVCVSNTDDHLRNHGFMLTDSGWALAPAYDMNPDPHGEGLKLNISESDNAQNLELVLEVAADFRLKGPHAKKIVNETVAVVAAWREVASATGLSKACQDRMRRAFRVADKWA
ncbi:MAG: type II toxin-antitoxin system HipA family toxin [Deltaproteobacteria bacterium]|nr:type II toxin-antitoxin system HipA family toxin [Deltaproteobacteria bacterium]